LAADTSTLDDEDWGDDNVEVEIYGLPEEDGLVSIVGEHRIRTRY
jgi:hypothetical protein